MEKDPSDLERAQATLSSVLDPSIGNKKTLKSVRQMRDEAVNALLGRCLETDADLAADQVEIDFLKTDGNPSKELNALIRTRKRMFIEKFRDRYRDELREILESSFQFENQVLHTDENIRKSATDFPGYTYDDEPSQN